MEKTDKGEATRGSTVYCLRLEGEHYYVGRTTNLQRRVDEHIAGHGAAWTKLHPVIGMDQKWENCDEFDEDKYLKVTMRKYGIDKVRGGSYPQCELSTEQRNSLQKELHGATNACFKCGSPDHWASSCTQQMAPRQRPAQREESPDLSVMGLLGKGLIALGWMLQGNNTEARESKKAEIICFKCGKVGHILPQCPVRIEVKCYTCGKPGHMSPACGLVSKG